MINGWHLPTILAWTLFVGTGIFLAFAVTSPAYLIIAAINTATFIYILFRIIYCFAIKTFTAITRSNS